MTDRKDWKLATSVPPACMCEEAFLAMRENHITEIELSAGYLPMFVEMDYWHRAREYYDMAASFGVNISSIHLPFGPFSEIDPASLDANVRANFLKVQTELIGAAAESGIPMAVVHPSGEAYKDEEREERMKVALDSFGKLMEIAKKAGMVLALENLPRTCLCRTYDEMQTFLRELPDLKVCFDTNHCLLQNNADYIRAVGDRIVTLHVSDYDFKDEKHWLPGMGKNDWEGIFTALEEVDYKGRFLYETISGIEAFPKLYENYRVLIR